MDKYSLLFALYSRKYNRIGSLVIDITVLEYYFSYYYLFVIIGYIRIIRSCMYKVGYRIYMWSLDSLNPTLRTVNNIKLLYYSSYHNLNDTLLQYYY